MSDVDDIEEFKLHSPPSHECSLSLAVQNVKLSLDDNSSLHPVADAYSINSSSSSCLISSGSCAFRSSSSSSSSPTSS